jgi:hypothetical protein
LDGTAPGNRESGARRNAKMPAGCSDMTVLEKNPENHTSHFVQNQF